MRRKKLVKPTKLEALFSFALVTGLTLAIQIHTGMDVSETGIGLTIIESISKITGDQISGLVPAISILFMLINGGITVHHVKTAAEHRKRGALVSGGGFFGMLALILGSLGGVEFVTFLGLALCIMGGGISSASRKF